MTLKDYFKHEERGFTPWLAVNSHIIRDILNDSSARLYKREFRIDGFYIDLLYQGKKGTIVVENQFGESDHDHLGKVISYSSLVRSPVCIWIAESFRREHLKIQESLTPDVYLVSCMLENDEKNDDIYMKLVIESKETSRVLLYRVGETAEKMYDSGIKDIEN